MKLNEVKTCQLDSKLSKSCSVHSARRTLDSVDLLVVLLNLMFISVVHIHLGSRSKDGPFCHVMAVSVDASGLNGRFSGEIKVVKEEGQALEFTNL